MDILKWSLIAISIPLIGWLVVRTKKNAGRLNERITEYKKEQEALQKQGGAAPDPYAQMMELFAPEEDDKDK